MTTENTSDFAYSTDIGGTGISAQFVKGELLAGTDGSSYVMTRVAPGTDGQVLHYNSAANGGVEPHSLTAADVSGVLTAANNLDDVQNVITAATNLGLLGATFYKGWVTVATTVALPSCTYNNGVSGVGATLTATSNGALTVDSHAVGVSDTIIVKNQVDARQNGVYVVTNPGSAGTAFVLTRPGGTDFGSLIVFGDIWLVGFGTVNASALFYQTSSNIVIGTTNIGFSGFGPSTVNTVINKTLDSSTNTIRATSLATSGAPVQISGSTPPVYGDVLTALDATTAAWQSLPVTPLTKAVFVDGAAPGGGNGSVEKPFNTIAAALAAISSPSSATPYTIFIAPGVYNETTINLKPWVSLKGSGYYSTFINVANPIGLDSSWSGLSGVLQTISDLNPSPSTWDLDFNALSAQGEIDFNNFYNPTGDMAFTGLTGSPSLITFFNSQTYVANFNAANANLFFSNSYFEAYASFTNAATGGTAISSYIEGGQLLNTLVSSSDGTSTNTIQYQGVDVQQGISLITVNPGATSATGDSSSYPKLGFTLSGAAIVNFPYINHARAFSPQTLAANTARQPSITNDMMINFSGTIVNVSALDGVIALQTSPDNSTWTLIQKFDTTLATTGITVPFSAIVPAGYYYRWLAIPSAGGTVSISTIQELSL